MFDRRFMWTGAAVAAIALLSFLLARTPEPSQVAPITESVSGVELKQPAGQDASGAEDGYQYMIKELDGRVAVYAADADEPELVLDVYVKYLPDYDRSQMQAGIPVKNYEELVSLIEDYTS